jgi:hypothetical protein
MFPRAVLALLCALSLPGTLWAQSEGTITGAHVPALDAPLSEGDGRPWQFATRIDRQSVTVTATAEAGALAVSLRRMRQGSASCRTLMSQWLHTEAIERFAAPTPAVFRGARWEPAVFQQQSTTHQAEFGCLTLGGTVWLASALARAGVGVSLTDAASVAQRLADALASPGARQGYPVQLRRAGLELEDPRDGAAWLFADAAARFPVPSDTLSSGAGGAGGVTLTVARREGSCEAAWQALRPSLASEGTLVDRPGYVPAVFGSRVRRIASGERMREVYCTATPTGALLVTAVFQGDDGAAMERMAPMLRAIATAALPRTER